MPVMAFYAMIMRFYRAKLSHDLAAEKCMNPAIAIIRSPNKKPDPHTADRAFIDRTSN
jgi:hypothetical protein